MLRKFAAFPEIQVIDLDAAMGKGENSDLVELVARNAKCRVGGGVRTPERAQRLIEQGAYRVIVGTAAFTPAIKDIAAAVGPERILIALDSKHGKIVVKGWQEATNHTAEEIIGSLEPYCSGFLCTYVDKEGMMQGTDLDWFRRFRAATKHELTAAGGVTTLDDVRALQAMNVHAALQVWPSTPAASTSPNSPRCNNSSSVTPALRYSLVVICPLPSRSRASQIRSTALCGSLRQPRHVFAPALLMAIPMLLVAILWLAVTYFRFAKGALSLSMRSKTMVVSCALIVSGWLFFS